MKWPKQFSTVTIVVNETGEEIKGMILSYTPEIIRLRQVKTYKAGVRKAVIRETLFDATKVHFKGEAE